MHVHGKEVSQEQTAQFAMLFPAETSALKFGLHLLRQGYWVQVNAYADQPGFRHEVLLDIVLPMTHGAITEAQQWLAERFAPLGGQNDGGSFGGESIGSVA